ncbi:hypothetical protein DS878_13055 [Marinobacter sp. F3R11]|nr:hypothetical protein DS878_13055 [Marinobacter sp. F3R11]
MYLRYNHRTCLCICSGF